MHREDMSDRCTPLETADGERWRVLSVGWLRPIDAGAFGSPDVQLALQTMSLVHRYGMLQMRGIHVCEFCVADGASSDEVLERQRFASPVRGMTTLGSCEIWIPASTGERVLYAAPSLIPHYIETHGYVPPAGFVRAVQFANAHPVDQLDAYATIMERIRSLDSVPAL